MSVNVLVKFDFNMLTVKNLNASSLSWSRISCESVCVCKSCIRVVTSDAKMQYRAIY